MQTFAWVGKLAVGSFPGVSYSVSLAKCLVLDFAPEHVRFDFLNERVDCQWAQLGGCRKVCDETVGGPWPTAEIKRDLRSLCSKIFNVLDDIDGERSRGQKTFNFG